MILKKRAKATCSFACLRGSQKAATTFFFGCYVKLGQVSSQNASAEGLARPGPGRKSPQLAGAFQKKGCGPWESGFAVRGVCRRRGSCVA